MLLIISLVYIIIFLSVSLCRIHLSLNSNKVYALPIVGLHALPNSPRILTAGLQAHITLRIPAYRATRAIQLVFTHIMYMKTSVRESESDCPGKVLSGKRLLFFGLTQCSPNPTDPKPYGISIGSAVFCRTHDCDKQTDATNRQTTLLRL